MLGHLLTKISQVTIKSLIFKSNLCQSLGRVLMIGETFGKGGSIGWRRRPRERPKMSINILSELGATAILLSVPVFLLSDPSLG